MNYPVQLTERKQWISWRLSNGNKIPMTLAGTPAKTNDPDCFSEFDDVRELKKKAFVIQGSDPFVGIDLDNCLESSGKLKQWAIPIVACLVNVAYGEVSPSGNGLKFLTRAKKLPGSRCQVKTGDGLKEQLEVYEFNRFWCMTGDVYPGAEDIGDGQAAVEWLCEEYLSAPPAKQQPALVAEGGADISDFNPDAIEGCNLSMLSVEARAEAYVQSADRPLEGGRNNAAFRLAGHLRSMEDTNGRRLDERELTFLLVLWNSRLSEPLEECELRRCIANSKDKGTPPPPKVSKANPFVASIPETPHIACPKPKPTFPDECKRPPGIICDIIDYTLARSLFPQPELALGGALALLGTVCGRKITDGLGTRTNVYVIGLAPSGAGKEQARQTNKELLELSGGNAMNGPERIGSSAGLTNCVEANPSILFQLDELSRLLETVKNPGKAPHLYNIASVLMTMYSNSGSVWTGDAYADVKNIATINQPSPCVYGTAVNESFWNAMTVDSLSDGLVGRLMPFEAGRVRPKEPERIKPHDALVEAIAYWVNHSYSLRGSEGGVDLSELSPAPVVIEHTEDAWERMIGHMRKISEKHANEGTQEAALWSRTSDKTAKLALLFAISRKPGRDDFMIELQDVGRAIAMSNFLTRSIQWNAVEHISTNSQEERTKKVYRMLNKPMSKSELTKRTQWLKSRERDEILETLIGAGLILQKAEKTERRPRTIYYRLDAIS